MGVLYAVYVSISDNCNSFAFENTALGEEYEIDCNSNKMSAPRKNKTSYKVWKFIFKRHLMSRNMIENEQSTAINPSEAVEEKVSLSDRFGLWLGFHNMDQDTYFKVVDGYVQAMGLKISAEDLHHRANEWSITRGARSGRVAWQFCQDLAGELKG